MNVKELMEMLQQADEEMTVVLQRDSEGNGYSPLEYTWDGIYVPETRWIGEIVDLDDPQNDGDAERVFILAPMN